MTLEIQKIFTSINYLLGISNIDHQRIGIYGISGGANLALHVAALDKRITKFSFSMALGIVPIIFT